MQERPDVKAACEAWSEGQLGRDPARPEFLDKTWASTDMARSGRHSPRGEELRSRAPHGHRKTTTVEAGPRLSGIALFMRDGPIDRDAFRTYVDRVLVPELVPGDIVVMGKLGSHEGLAVRAASEAAGVRPLFLPPCSPDFDPIAPAFSKRKAIDAKAL